jgi:hypothetical protein
MLFFSKILFFQKIYKNKTQKSAPSIRRPTDRFSKVSALDFSKVRALVYYVLHQVTNRELFQNLYPAIPPPAHLPPPPSHHLFPLPSHHPTLPPLPRPPPRLSLPPPPLPFVSLSLSLERNRGGVRLLPRF